MIPVPVISLPSYWFSCLKIAVFNVGVICAQCCSYRRKALRLRGVRGAVHPEDQPHHPPPSSQGRHCRPPGTGTLLIIANFSLILVIIWKSAIVLGQRWYITVRYKTVQLLNGAFQNRTGTLHNGTFQSYKALKTVRSKNRYIAKR